MKGRGARREVRGAIGLALLLFAIQPVSAAVATNSEIRNEPALPAPPRAELPPSFRERYGSLIFFSAVALSGLAALIVWQSLRPRPVARVPIEIQARQELERLCGQSESGRTLSEVSRALRRYMAGAFELPPEEMTTSEFCRALAASEKIGADLAGKVAEFLRRCDEVKFAPSSAPAQTGAAARALELVGLGEARRAQLRQSAAGAAAPPARSS